MYWVWLMEAILFSFQMVFSNREEIISGGNFHGEYPAKVHVTHGCHVTIMWLVSYTGSWLFGYWHPWNSQYQWKKNWEADTSRYMVVMWPLANHIHLSLLAAYSDMPAFLVKEGGLNSGFMIAHCTAAALGKYTIKSAAILLILKLCYSISIWEQGADPSIFCGFYYNLSWYRRPCINGRVLGKESHHNCWACGKW